MKRSMLALALLAVPSVAVADDAKLGVEKKEATNSLNVSALGIVAGNYALTYEHLFNGHHGVIVEGILTRNSGEEGSSLQYGGAAGYRWHWSGKQASGFLGVMVAQGFGTGEVTINGGMAHEMSVKSTTVTGNIGKRWAWGPVNATLRIGLGYGNYSAKAKDQNNMEAKNAEETMNAILAFLPIGFDGELSIGFNF
jgi:hypothetical protein